MTQVINLGIQGLVTNVNAMAAGEGTLSVADNVTIDQQGVAQMRRGFQVLSPHLSSRMVSYSGHLLATVGDRLLTLTSNGERDNGEIQSPIHTAQAHGNLYLSSPTGIVKLDSIQGRLTPAGVPKALAIRGTLKSKGDQVAYRVVWGYTDANKNLHIGAPSERCRVTHSEHGNTLEFAIPQEITENHFFQLYRSQADQEPSDELQLALQRCPTNSEIKTGMVTINDTTASSSLEGSLYTNETQEGILQANHRPLVAKDLALYRDCLFYCNTESSHRVILSLTQIGGTDGLAVGDTLTVNSTSFQGADVEDPAKQAFAVSQDLSVGVTQTVKSFIRVLNQTQMGVYGYLLETDDDPDSIGKIYLESNAQFEISISAHDKAFDPPLPQRSQNEVKKNAIYFSKYRQPEAVPMLNHFFCGNDGQELLRLIPLRDGLFALGDGGIYRISGWTPESFTRETFDSTVKLIAPESPAVLSNHIFCLTNQGVVAIADSGVTPVSGAIDDRLRLLLDPQMFETTKRVAFGIAYESDRKYILFAPSCPTDLVATQAFVYSAVTKAWTRWCIEASFGFLHPTEDQIYLCTPNGIATERKTGTEADYWDDSTPVVSRIEWLPQHAGNPFTLKQWAECSLSFRNRGTVKADFKTELSPSTDEITFAPGQCYCRTYVPRTKQISAQQTVGVTCIGPFELEGMGLVVHTEMSERISR